MRWIDCQVNTSTSNSYNFCHNVKMITYAMNLLSFLTSIFFLAKIFTVNKIKNLFTCQQSLSLHSLDYDDHKRIKSNWMSFELMSTSLTLHLTLSTKLYEQSRETLYSQKNIEKSLQVFLLPQHFSRFSSVCMCVHVLK